VKTIKEFCMTVFSIVLVLFLNNILAMNKKQNQPKDNSKEIQQDAAEPNSTSGDILQRLGVAYEQESHAVLTQKLKGTYLSTVHTVEELMLELDYATKDPGIAKRHCCLYKGRVYDVEDFEELRKHIEVPSMNDMRKLM